MSYAAEEISWSANDEAMLLDGLVEILDNRFANGVSVVAVNRNGQQELIAIGKARNIASDILSDIENAHRDSYAGKYLCEGRSNQKYILFPGGRYGWCMGLDEAKTIATDILVAIANHRGESNGNSTSN